jgi:hypothetical protein
MVETVRHNSECQRLNLGLRFRRTQAIRQDARQFKDFSDPAAVLFLLDFHSEGYRNPPFLPSPVILCSPLRGG